ncbi:MAG: MFS transporter [Alphaproteobacteria bacterium]|nr:MFS transporter [Alphaproteobacteria bacterium]
MTNSARKSEAFFGWAVVPAAFVLAMFGWGVGFYGPPIYLHSVIERTGWPLLLVSSAVTLHFLFGALIVVNLPAFYRRFGVASVTIAGAVLLAIGIFGWSIAASPWQLFVAALLSGAGWVAMGAAAINAIISPWFVRQRPAALSTAYNGASVGGIVMSPLWVALIAALGFAMASVLVGIAMVIAVCVLSLLFFAKTPESMGQQPDGAAAATVEQAHASGSIRSVDGSTLWRDPSFLTLAAGMALGLFAQIGLIAHLFSILVPVLGQQAAGFAMGLATACAIGGRMIVGFLMPEHADRRLVASLSYGVQVIGSVVFLMANGNPAMMLLGVALFGSGIGNATSLPPLIAQVEFRKDDVKRVVPLIVAIGQATYAFAPAAFGLIRVVDPAFLGFGQNHTALFFIVAAAAQLLAIGCFLAGRKRLFSGADLTDRVSP